MSIGKGIFIGVMVMVCSIYGMAQTETQENPNTPKSKKPPFAVSGYISKVNDTLSNETNLVYVVIGNKLYDYSSGAQGLLEYEINDGNHFTQYRYSNDSGAGTVPSKFYYDANALIELCPQSRDTIAVWNNGAITSRLTTGDTYQYTVVGNRVKVTHILKPKDYITYYEVNGIPPSLFAMILQGGHCYH